ncbi:PREDICTED: nudix hydrolase 8-like isoform X2 [Populus euphratica]|uniref:Nudix hydrolase 8-like isoform X2 n=1 Tax=Populus euphratica TaxID=75702 RepID=A0AAJ6UL63_POPEU|nr:PREDICTED: nudix hydrolase 8-like isoform X2 [Populus euphratica]
MELKLLDSKSSSLSKKAALVARTKSSPFSSFEHSVGVKFSQEFSSCRVFTKASYLSLKGTFMPKTAISSVDKEKTASENYFYQISTNGAGSSLFSRNVGGVLDACDDEYGGVVVDQDRLPVNPDAFAPMLQVSLSHWKMKGKKGIWLKLPLERSELVPVAVKEGFEYHHAERGYVMLTYWIPEGPCMLPSNATHQVGVGGFVINDKNEVLVVQEKFYAPSFADLWKIPTGFILESEEIYTGAVREVKEETGVDTEFVEVIAFRHAHNLDFDKSDLFFVCMLKPLSAQIKVDNLEIQAAKWMPLVEFVAQPLIQEDGLFKKIVDICIAQLGKRYCGLLPRQVVSKFDGRPSCLYYNVLDTGNVSCNGN